MRYPLWAFFFVLVMPLFATHALLTGKADMQPREAPRFSVMSVAQATVTPAWSVTTHRYR